MKKKMSLNMLKKNNSRIQTQKENRKKRLGGKKGIVRKQKNIRFCAN